MLKGKYWYHLTQLIASDVTKINYDFGGVFLWARTKIIVKRYKNKSEKELQFSFLRISAGKSLRNQGINRDGQVGTDSEKSTGEGDAISKGLVNKNTNEIDRFLEHKKRYLLDSLFKYFSYKNDSNKNGIWCGFCA